MPMNIFNLLLRIQMCLSKLKNQTYRNTHSEQNPNSFHLNP